jgi:hypothetical protein
MDKPLEPGVRKKGRNTYQVSTEYLKEDFEKMGPEKFKQLMKDKKPKTMKKGGLSAGQKKIAAKAPPPDKIDAKDFAVLKAEKAKGRGMGLQDESVQPGKVMKAKRGEFLRSDPTKPISSVQPSTTLPKDFLGKRKALGGVRASLGMLKGPAKAGAILGAALTVPVGKMLKKIQDKRKAKNRDEAKVKKMGGGMMKKYSKGGDLRAEYIHSQTKKNRKVTGEGYFTERSATRREEYGAAKDRYPNKMDRRKQMLKNLSRVLNPTMGVVKGTIDALNAPTTRKYSVGGGADMGDPKKPTAIPKGKDSEVMIYNRSSHSGLRPVANAPTKVLKKAKAYYAASNRDEAKVKKMVGGMAKKYSVGGGADMGKVGEYKSKFAVVSDRIRRKKKEGVRLTQRDLDFLEGSLPKKMGGGMMQRPMGGPMGGMMQRPMGYKKGTMVKARGCKLGRTRPTKMY